MQFRNFIIFSVFIGLVAFVFGTRLLGRSKNSVFDPKNFVKNDSEKLEDLKEAKRLQAKNMKIKNPSSKKNKPNFLKYNKRQIGETSNHSFKYH